MSLRWSSYVAPNSPKGGSKTQIGRFSSTIALRLKKVCYKVSLCENFQRRGCRAFIGLIIDLKIISGGRPLSTWNFKWKWPRWSEIADFRSIFSRSASTVTPSGKIQLTLIGSPLRAFRWAQDEHRTLSLTAPKGSSKRQKRPRAA